MCIEWFQSLVLVLSTNYIINVGKNITKLRPKFSDDKRIYHSKNAEDAISQRYTRGIKNNIINIYSAEAGMKYKRHDKLDELKRTADNNNDPWNIFGFDIGNEMNPKAKGNGKKDIVEDIFEAVLWQVIEARAKVIGDKV